MKQERDEAFYDLDGLLNEQKGDLQAAVDEAAYWETERYVALEAEDIDWFNEMQASWENAKANVAKVQAKVDATDV